MKLTKERDALLSLSNASSMYKGTLAQHQTIQSAISTLESLIDVYKKESLPEQSKKLDIQTKE